MNQFFATGPLSINAYAAEVKKWRQDHGFYTPSTLLTELERDQMLGKLMLCVTELAEAAEAVRHNDVDNFIEEIADSFIRHMDIVAAMGIDIEWAIRQKMLRNEERPFKHGKMCSL